MHLLKSLLLVAVINAAMNLSAAVGYDRALRVAKGNVNIADVVGNEKAFRRVAFTVATSNPKLNVSINPMPFAAAFAALKAGKVQIVVTDRLPSRSQRQKEGIRCFRYAIDPVLFVVKTDNPLDNISISDLQKIFNEDILSWEPFTKQGYMIHLAGTHDNCPGFRALNQVVLKNRKIKAKYYKLEKASELVILTTASKHMLGFCGFISPGVQVKLLKVDGVEPTIKNIMSGKYRPSVSYYVCLNEKSGKTAYAIAGMLGTSRVRELMQQIGYLPASISR
ncbi:substrate-binding domain-containing protein [Lentisphaerota bacterium ZTH]|nr:substrate-binding domain-containing protein [Lentisphaerota bacterium]WET06465.1 substrate-binding domain-containing protein [Lentisphaerota bacterium ZTH]